jgi:hypothetical protein
MDPLKVAAQFAAYVWFCHHQAGPQQTEAEAIRFAHENWVAFLPSASESVGRLLLRLVARREALMQRRLRQRAARG